MRPFESIPAAGDAAERGGGAAMGLLVSLRPRQWVKNLALLAALVFSRRGEALVSVARALAAVGLFCLLAGSVYLFNDLLDRERDRVHPEKRLRPIASGAVSPRLAAIASALLAAGALGGAFALSAGFAEAALAYLVLQAAYSLWVKHWVLLDVFAIAAGFVLRVVAGALVIDVPISNWLYLCTLLLSLFLALGKRRAELSTLLDASEGHRPNLAHYSVPLLDQLIGIVSACTILAYALYTLAPETTQKFGDDRLKFTVPCVMFGLFRYLYLVHRRGKGASPERVLLSDGPLLASVGLFLALVVWAVY
ncbi:MAG: decaprenyl-phosphate phosphoribosyltransferase [Deltaproteobacteria bacterium]